ncbi:uncharacterized protein N7529_004518 [Penicillium soppii]|uniref:uncharacterized protein n=1 Tax=Penicillium soppii TaxID=69789 RepID=UPI0025475904|nr:uncharacterized protein N7529_004518 [Penicillium soppii]KAJ5872165.1 hypothetical protein N7529_004518 [Penicillium soppii]
MDEPDLQCIICTKRPQFCDLSHLLTHVASKAHLASQFGLKVRSTANPKAAELLKRYDDWYEAHNLGPLLSLRLHSKEQRKKRKSEEKTPNVSKSQPRIKQESTLEPVGFSTPAALPVSDCIDPRLAGTYNSQQKKDADSPATPIRWTAVNSNERTRTGPILRSVRTSMDQHSTETFPPNGSELGNNKLSVYPVTPVQPRRKRKADDMDWAMGQETPNPSIDSADRTRSSGITGSRAEEIARLKGVLWPGMDCFDAATEAMRRRRNQKKDGTVLKQMEITSMIIEPSELIFSPSGKFLKERVITGNVEEDTPLKGETPVPRRRQARPRVPLARADPNVPRAADRKRQRSAVFNRRKITSEVSIKEDYKSPRRSRRVADPIPTHASYDGEFEMSVNTFGERARGGFNVFADGEGGKHTYLGQDMESKGQFGTLTPTRLLLDNKSNASGIRASKATHTSANKENIEPILNAQGRIGFGLGPHGWYSPFAKRTGPDELGTLYFDEPSLLGLSGPFNGNLKSGYRSNPLFAPKPPAYDNPFKQEDNEANHDGWSSILKAPASEETISEENLEFPGLYQVTCAD